MNLCREKTGREDASQHATTKKCLSGTPRARKTAGQQREDPRRLECHFALFRNRPLKVKEPHFPVLRAWRGSSSYAKRYELFCQRLVLERLYDAACFLLSEKERGRDGWYAEPSDELTFHPGRGYTNERLRKAPGMFSGVLCCKHLPQGLPTRVEEDQGGLAVTHLRQVQQKTHSGTPFAHNALGDPKRRHGCRASRF